MMLWRSNALRESLKNFTKELVKKATELIGIGSADFSIMSIF